MLPDQIERIIIARGADPEAVRRITAQFPRATVEHQPDVPPSRVELAPAPVRAASAVSRRSLGKRTLVIGSIARVLDRNAEPSMGDRIVCFPYWHFNAVGNCPYDCSFCYLAGNRGNLKCPSMKIYTNLDDVVSAITRVADRSNEPVLFYGSKLQDFIALDPIARHSQRLVPFAAEHPNVRLLFLTKSGDIDAFLPLDHGGHTILSWTLNAEPVIERYETGAPSLDARLAAARAAADAGYEVRFVFMPMIPIPHWRRAYAEAVKRTLATIRPSRITLGGICMYRSALNSMKRHATAGLGPILDNLQPPAFARDRYRYHPEMRYEIYRHVIDCIGRVDATVPVALCLETPEMWRGLGLDPLAAACNCLI